MLKGPGKTEPERDHAQTHMANTHTAHPHPRGGADVGQKQPLERGEMRILSEGPPGAPIGVGCYVWDGFHGNSLLSSPKTLQVRLPRLLQPPAAKFQRLPLLPLWAPTPGRTRRQGVSCHTRISRLPHPCLPRPCLLFSILGSRLLPPPPTTTLGDAWLPLLEVTEAQGEAELPKFESFPCGVGRVWSTKGQGSRRPCIAPNPRLEHAFIHSSHPYCNL